MDSIVIMLRTIERCPVVVPAFREEAGFLARLIQSPGIGRAMTAEYGPDWRNQV